MKWLKSRILWGSLLVIFGILVLLENIGMVSLGAVTAAILISLGGIFFISLFLEARERWWALIPGITLLGVAIIILMSEFFPGLADNWSGMVILGGIGLSFLVIYLTDRRQWWAIIPAGVMITLGVVAGLSDTYGIDGGAIFFLGLSLTFAFLALTPTKDGKMRWAWIPALILFLISGIVFSQAMPWFQYFWPSALIIVGGYLIVKNFLIKK